MRISDWSSDVCSSDLRRDCRVQQQDDPEGATLFAAIVVVARDHPMISSSVSRARNPTKNIELMSGVSGFSCASTSSSRSEEHTSELQSLMRISYAVFCLKKKKYHSILLCNEQECILVHRERY